MATLELKTQEALVFIDFLIRFRDKEIVEFEHPAESQLLFDLGAALEQQIPEITKPRLQIETPQSPRKSGRHRLGIDSLCG